ncbi:MAG TPA: hypothetical protein VIX86_13135 [Streptosporangiaceae bacterium]
MPGTPLQKVIPHRLVEPYLNGQRSVIAGYVYLAQDSSFSDPASYYHALALGYEGSEFSPDMTEICVLRWLALDMTGSLLPVAPSNGYGPASTVPEFYTLPVPIPVGTEMYRVTTGTVEFIARYDGQVWLRPVRGN